MSSVIFGNPIVSESNSSSVSVIDLTLTDEELLRLAREQARRRGRRARLQRARAKIEHMQLKRAETASFVLRERCHELERLLYEKEKELATLREETKTSGRECVVCLGNEADRLLMPCKHLALCRDCAKALERQARIDRTKYTCPICRKIVQMTFRIYFASE